MNELQIVNLEQTDITKWDFAAIKEELGKALSVYSTTEYTDENIKTAKDDKAYLAKAKKIIDDRRKEFKKQCLAPYEALEPQVKEIEGMIEEQRGAIDEFVRNYTARKKEEKKEKIRLYYDKKSTALGELAGPLFEKIMNPKWLNESASMRKTA